MKVVLFCGGLGLRMGETSARVPKPMIPIGEQPILWHIMKYYASFGIRDFILCLGYKAEVIKEYFLLVRGALERLRAAGRRQAGRAPPERHPRLVDHVREHRPPGADRRAPGRVEPYLDGDEIFLANYGDGLTDAPLPDMIETLEASGKTGLFLCSRPTYNFHVVPLGAERRRDVAGRDDDRHLDQRGYFVFRREIFD